MSDREIIRKIHNGDKSAMNLIIEKYYDDIYRFCLYLTGSETDACDLTQETFLRFIHYVDSYRYRNLKGYLVIIARNLCRNYFAQRHTLNGLNDWEDSEKADTGAQAEWPMERVENKLYLLRLLQSLPVEQREVVVLRIYGDLKFKEIASMLNCNLSTTKSRYQLGIANMKRCMEREEDRHES